MTNKKSITFSLLLLILLGHISLLLAGNLPFRYHDYRTALNEADKSGKPLLINFYASWCSPCQWMEETTFKDEQLIALLEQDFVALHVNIDQADGLHLKEKYDVRFLPTILVIDKQGRVLERIEESIGANKLHQILSAPGSLLREMKPGVNSNPKDYMSKIRENKTYSLSSLPQANPSPLPQASGALYRIQLGVFSSYEGAIRLIQLLNSKFVEPTMILREVQGEQTRFKVLLGEFPDKGKAYEFRHDIEQNHQLSGFVI